MTMNINTLIKLLKNFQEELHVCMDHKNREGTVSGGVIGKPDPILLGDFIVEAYNNYLTAAKACCDHPLIQTLSPVEKLDEATGIADTTRVGSHPRLQKMHEVALATRQLVTCLEQAIQTGQAGTYSETIGVMALLESLGDNLRHLERDIADAKLTGRHVGDDEWREAARPLLDAYNQYVNILQEQTEDPVLRKLFRPLEPDEARGYSYLLSQVKLAQTGLLTYLRKTAERQE
ncbi:MAG: hypothetical protein HY710_04430 [Candidatus Latescibacteria bacterium]|nr:hypothetical protein [Candidatus Latescibacterota bacterium]